MNALLLCPLLHTLGFGCLYGCTASLGFIGWQGIKSRYPQRGLCWEWVWGGWYLDTAACSTASVLAVAAYIVLFNAGAVGDRSGLSCPSSLVFPALDVLPASRSGFSEEETSITTLHHVLCCEIHLGCCSVACEKACADPFPD